MYNWYYNLPFLKICLWKRNFNYVSEQATLYPSGDQSLWVISQHMGDAAESSLVVEHPISLTNEQIPSLGDIQDRSSHGVGLCMFVFYLSQKTKGRVVLSYFLYTVFPLYTMLVVSCCFYHFLLYLHGWGLLTVLFSKKKHCFGSFSISLGEACHSALPNTSTDSILCLRTALPEPFAETWADGLTTGSQTGWDSIP